MNQIGGPKKRRIENSSGYHRNSRLGKSQAHPLGGKGMLPHNPLTDSRVYENNEEDDQNFSKKFDDFQTIQTPGGVKNAKGPKQVQIVSDFNASIKT